MKKKYFFKKLFSEIGNLKIFENLMIACYVRTVTSWVPSGFGRISNLTFLHEFLRVICSYSEGDYGCSDARKLVSRIVPGVLPVRL